jgi:hypothetical protein
LGKVTQSRPGKESIYLKLVHICLLSKRMKMGNILISYTLLAIFRQSRTLERKSKAESIYSGTSILIRSKVLDRGLSPKTLRKYSVGSSNSITSTTTNKDKVTADSWGKTTSTTA